MDLGFRRHAPYWVTLALASLLSATSARSASAADAGDPCGNFDFSQGISCKIEISGGCTADCTPLNLEVGCSGSCTQQVPPDSTCTTYCDSSCSSTCDPDAIDCMAGCHGECDQSMTEICEQQTPNADCVTQAKAQCDMHCQQSCAGAPANCPGQCQACCVGSCNGQLNYQCDFDCFANLQGSCSVQCQQPGGAIFCNGQYVNASDVEACIDYLATQGISVDVSARGSVECDSTGCSATADGTASASACAVAAPGGTAGLEVGVAAAIGLAAVGAARRRSRRSK